MFCLVGETGVEPVVVTVSPRQCEGVSTLNNAISTLFATIHDGRVILRTLALPLHLSDYGLTAISVLWDGGDDRCPHQS